MNFIFLHPGFLNLGPTELVVILLIAVILFGGKLPDVARTIGKGFFEFKKNLRDLQDDIYRQDIPPPRTLPKPYHDEASDQKYPGTHVDIDSHTETGGQDDDGDREEAHPQSEEKKEGE